MTLHKTIEYYKNLNKQSATAFAEKIPDIQIQRIIEESFKGNLHLSIVFSNAINASEKEFLIAAFYALKYDDFDVTLELGSYTIQNYTYEQTIAELSIPKTVEILKEYKVTVDNCMSILKLKEKDELTFLIKTKTEYIFITEIFWWS
jgi:hypothetical protein